MVPQDRRIVELEEGSGMKNLSPERDRGLLKDPQLTTDRGGLDL